MNKNNPDNVYIKTQDGMRYGQKQGINSNKFTKQTDHIAILNYKQKSGTFNRY
jgi:hypothetical protein